MKKDTITIPVEVYEMLVQRIKDLEAASTPYVPYTPWYVEPFPWKYDRQDQPFGPTITWSSSGFVADPNPEV